ncbi:MAG: [protein-PII] uridylyltransferase, partial [Allosphingosinicella sp.]
SAEELLRLGHKQKGRRERIAATQEELAARLKWEQSRFAGLAWRLPDSYWLAEPIEVLELNARFILTADKSPKTTKPVQLHVLEDRAATLATIYATDQPGLFYRVAGAISLVGGNIIDARIHTTNDGMALDNLLIQDVNGAAFGDRHQLKRLEAALMKAVAGEEPELERLAARALPLRRAEAFSIQPAVFVDNSASSRYTVVEINARDRAALLCELARAITEARATIHSAHIATYGERAVDVFYLTDLHGQKLEAPTKVRTLQAKLLKAASRDSSRRLQAA